MHKVMLVEDDPTMLSLLNTLLEIEGFNVFETKDFRHALDEIRAAKPDLVLLDVHLQEYDGFEILEGIRQDQVTKDIAVIMSSGMALKDDCLDKGANNFIMKPYMPDELIGMIKQQLEKLG
ncbi:MAG: response regulator [Chloroflexi bacterium]|nr:response regulator [Chloroflexota bacterium]